MFKSFKKVISTLAAVAMLATSASAFAVDFPDVDKSASYAGAVNTLTALGIVNGDENGKFNPENTVTRAEFTKMVVEAIGEGSAASSSSYTKFADSQGHWGAGYIETGVAKGFINGYDENTFGPDDQVTYAQAVKMLVAAIGYTTYAENNGGWPSGYLAYGSSLDIIDGVTGVTNDTALTRAQCAVLIANTLKAPICKVDGYEKDFQGNWYPNYTEMDGTGKNWQTLLTTQHNAYAVKGRVTAVNKLDKEVSFNIEVAENFEDTYVEATAPSLKTVKVGDTNAVNMLFEYSEAIIQKDKNTSEYTMISIAPYGATETVEFAAADISDVTGTTISVKKEGTSKTTDYKLDSAELYVNGEVHDLNGATDGNGAISATVSPWLVNTNLRGTVTLVDSTETGSTSTDGKYDYVMVTYCQAAQVTSVKVADDSIKIRTDALGTIDWDPTDDTDMNVTIIKDDVEISAEDINENDIILVTCDKDGIDNSDWAEIFVSDKTVSGTATGKSTTTGKKYLLVDGEKYKFNNDSDIDTIPLNKAYTLYLDAMGYVYDYDADEASKNIGIVAQMYKENQNDTPTVVLIDANGDVQTYLTKTTADSDSIKAQVNSSDSDNLVKKLKGDAATLNKRFIEYRISNGKLVFEGAASNVASVGGSDVFKASTSKLGSYTIDETATAILDLDAYLSGKGEPVAYSYSSLENDNTYTGFVADRNTKTGVYGFAVLTSGTSSLRATSALAVVTSCGSVSSVDGVNVEVLTVARDGEEDIEVLVEKKASVLDSDPVTPGNQSTYGTPVIKEGSIIMYTVGSEGYVDYDDIKVIYSPYTNYKAMADAILADGSNDDLFTEVAANKAVDFGNAVTNSSLITLATDHYTINVGTADPDVEVFVAPVYTSTNDVLQIFKKQGLVGTVNVATDVEALTLSGANVYTYNYDKATGDGVSVSVGGTTQRANIFKNMYTDANQSAIDLSIITGVDFLQGSTTEKNVNYETAPMFAFVRVDDGDVTDVVYFVAE